jgi:hypothetical protein
VIVADADMLLAACALDDQALADFVFCENVLRESGMPCMLKGELVGGWDLCENGHMVSLLRDAVVQLRTALKCWSPIGTETSLVRTSSVVNQFADVVTFLHAYSSQVVLNTWCELSQKWDGAFADKALDQPMPLVPKEIADEPDSASLVQCADSAASCLSSITPLLPRSEEIRSGASRLQNARQQLRAGERARGVLWDIMITVSGLVGEAHENLPTELEDLVKEFNQLAGDETSVLHKLFKLADRRKAATDVRIADVACKVVFFSRDGGVLYDFPETASAKVEGLFNTAAENYFVNRFVDGNAVLAVQRLFSDARCVCVVQASM